MKQPYPHLDIDVKCFCGKAIKGYKPIHSINQSGNTVRLICNLKSRYNQDCSNDGMIMYVKDEKDRKSYL